MEITKQSASNNTTEEALWKLILAPYGWNEQMNEAAREFLKNYSDFIPMLIGQSHYKIDLRSLIKEARANKWRNTTLDEICADFDANGTTCELEEEEVDLQAKHAPEMDGSELMEAVDVAAELKNMVLQDISNQPKQQSTTRPLRKCRNKSTCELDHCVFCFNNKADREVYESHRCKDEAGNVTCPVLQTFVCMRCKATGKKAHTAKYCPLKPVITPEDCLAMELRRHKIHRKGVCTASEINLSAGSSSAIVHTKKRLVRL
ncbi:uncharacterized protein LOC120908505 [Anopheles arabiensis]|uniref:Uncharacterized protein n=1 Tax=Anopheles arabiensis TaxID=7173 RepID=A0A182I1H8_ANOAR|nr:uncharacterized protein LOC120908505 [Anopheles arabiensis]XP_040175479.1 uncharacterized protein LOC120908505 [Anopheles arabiensis]